MTIYALSTGPGISGIAVIRISGEETQKVIKLLYDSYYDGGVSNLETEPGGEKALKIESE